MPLAADLIVPAENAESLKEICSWDGFRPATYAASDFPVDVVRLEGSASPPLVVSRARRADTLKAMPASLRQRAAAAFDRAGRAPGLLSLAHGRTLDLAEGMAVMGIVNVTPDSFSDGGRFFDASRAVDRGLEMFREGAAVVDVGGESTRPATYGPAVEVSAEEEIRRVVPVIEGIRRATDRPVSVDTRKASVARAAIAAGADMVNDVSALRYDPEMPSVLAQTGAAAILMHMRGDDPRTMQEDVSYAHPLADIASFLWRAAADAIAAGIAPDRLAVDPGFGFGKSGEGNLLLLRYLAAFRSLGFPVAAGASRKGFVRRFSGTGDDASDAERLPGSLACLAVARSAGASIARVHDVADSVRFLRMLVAIEKRPAAPPVPAGAAVR